MQFLLGLVAGLIIGWIIEWIIDWQFWRVDPEKTSPHGAPNGTSAVAPSTGTSNDRLQADLAEAQARIAALEAQLHTTDAVPVAADAPVYDDAEAALDDLTKIKGIGPVFARRLNDAGITTYGQLAQATPDQVQDIVQAAEWQAIDPAAWVADARRLAAPGEGG